MIPGLYNNIQDACTFQFCKRPNTKVIYMIISARLSCVLALLFIFLIFSSCRKFDGDQDVPAYVSVDSLSVQTEYSQMGSTSHKITTLWFYVDGQLAGIYELPVFAPVLFEGNHELRIDPGIYMSGIKALRVPYPFYEPIILEEEFIPGQSIDLKDTLTTTYKEACDFVWMVDFEDPSVSLDSIGQSKVDVHRTHPEDNPEAFLSENSRYSGVVRLTPEKDFFLLATNAGSEEGFDLPQGDNNPVFLEFNFKCNNGFTVGVYINGISQIVQRSVVNVNPSEEWNKIYVNLKPVVNAAVGAVDFNIFFEGHLNTGVNEAYIYLDNIKLIHFK